MRLARPPRTAATANDRLGETIPSHATPTSAVPCASRWSGCRSGWVRSCCCLSFSAADNVFSRLAVFFSEVAVVTFGGAYAVLAYVAQAGRRHLSLASPGEMLAGLGMAETTPGPLIMVVQYVGFLAGYRAPGVLPPLLAGTLAGSAGDLGDVHAVLPLGVSRRALHRGAARRARARTRPCPPSPPPWSASF